MLKRCMLRGTWGVLTPLRGPPGLSLPTTSDTLHIRLFPAPSLSPSSCLCFLSLPLSLSLSLPPFYSPLYSSPPLIPQSSSTSPFSLFPSLSLYFFPLYLVSESPHSCSCQCNLSSCLFISLSPYYAGPSPSLFIYSLLYPFLSFLLFLSDLIVLDFLFFCPRHIL